MKSTISLTVIDLFSKLVGSVSSIFRIVSSTRLPYQLFKRIKDDNSCHCCCFFCWLQEQNLYPSSLSVFNSRSIIVCSCQKPAISDCWKLGFCTKPGQFQLCIKIFQSIICLGTVHESDDTHTTSTYNRGPPIPPPSSGGQQKHVYVCISSYSSHFSRGPAGWENLGTHHRQDSCCCQKEPHSWTFSAAVVTGETLLPEPANSFKLNIYLKSFWQITLVRISDVFYRERF